MTARIRRTIRNAFTLVEALLAAVILSMTVSAMVMPYVGGAQAQSENARHALAVTLAQDLMEEILAHPFSDPDDGAQRPGPDFGESSRDRFDNQDDYHGYYEGPGEIQPFRQGVLDGDYSERLARAATVCYVHVAPQVASDPYRFVQITVVVSIDSRELIRITRLSYANEVHDE